jgi:hypothetical protein
VAAQVAQVAQEVVVLVQIQSILLVMEQQILVQAVAEPLALKKQAMVVREL